MSPQNPQTFLDRDNWMRAVNASDVSHATAIIAFQIALSLDEEGIATLTNGQLADTLHFSQRTVARAVATLERRGFLIVQSFTDGSNRFRLGGRS